MMKATNENPYMKARQIANMSRATAAASMNVSESSIKEYELNRPVPEDILFQMSRTYKSNWLKLAYLERNAVFVDLCGGSESKFELQDKTKMLLSLILNIEKIHAKKMAIIEAAVEGYNDKHLIALAKQTALDLLYYVAYV